MTPPSEQGLPLRPRAAAFPHNPSSWATSSSSTNTHPTRLSGANVPQTAGSSSIPPNRTHGMKDSSSSDLFDMDSSRSSSTAPAAALALADRASMSKGASQEPTGSDTASQVLSPRQSKMPQVAKSTPLSTSSLTACSDASFESAEEQSATSLIAAIDPSPTFELTAIPGKGLGLVATRCIKRGELILRESPFLLVPLEHENQEILPDSARGAFERLPAEDKTKFISLNGRQDHKAEEDNLVNIVETNSIPLYKTAQTKEGTQRDFMGLGLFHTVSKINHSCTPNVGWIWYSDEGVIHLYAYTDIPVDMELCASYLDDGILYTQATRRHKLRQDYGFECLCTACNRSWEHVRATDENLRICSRICRRWERSELRNYARDLPRAVEEIMLMIDLLKKEGKWVLLGPSYEQLFHVYAYHGKEVEAKAAGQQALAAYMITHGPRKAAQLSFAIEARDPIQSPHWAELVHHRSDTQRVQLCKNTTMKQLPNRTLSVGRKTAGPTDLDAVTLVIEEEESETEVEPETETKMEVEMEMEVETDMPTPSPPEEDVTQDKKRWKGGDRKRGKKLRWDQDGPFKPPKSHKKKRSE